MQCRGVIAAGEEALNFGAIIRYSRGRDWADSCVG